MYTDKLQAVTQVGAGAELDLASTGVKGCSWVVMSPIVITRLLAYISTVFSSTANAVVTFYAYQAYNSSSGQISIGVLKVGTTAGVGAVGQVYYNTNTPYRAYPGQQIITNVTTAATTSGKVICGFEASEATDNVLDMLGTYVFNTP